ncbi:hypothetical protein MMC09_001475 [Bachmanniomyces sp. S44760]|nr:hypothetical protein [Bachmanniomyces sp. S44760]
MNISPDIRSLPLNYEEIFPSLRGLDKETALEILQASAERSVEKPLPPLPAASRKSSSVYELELADMLVSPASSNGLSPVSPATPSNEILPARVYLPPVSCSQALHPRSRSPPLLEGPINYNDSRTTSEPNIVQVPCGLQLPNGEVRLKSISYDVADQLSSKSLPHFLRSSKLRDDVSSASASRPKMSPVQNGRQRERLSSPELHMPDRFTSESDLSPLPVDLMSDTNASLIPRALNPRTARVPYQASSRFSLWSADSESTHEAGSGVGESLKSFARKALFRDSVANSFEEDRGRPRTRSMDRNSDYFSQNIQRRKASSQPSPSTNMTQRGRNSINQGINSMYDTLASLSLAPPPKVAPKTTLTASTQIPRGLKASLSLQTTPNGTRIPRELRSPAIQLSPYQELGPKVFETSKSPKGSRKERNPIKDGAIGDGETKKRKRTSIVRRISSGVQTYRNDLKRSDSEKRRGKMKKQIVVVRNRETDF